jgi:hypothetical protein
MAPSDRFLEFCEEILALDASIMFSAIVDHIGDIVALTYRKTPFVDEKEAKQYAIQMTIAAILLAHFENRMGAVHYIVTYHDKIVRVALPLTSGTQKFFVLLLLDSGSDIVSVMRDKISPFVMRNSREVF